MSKDSYIILCLGEFEELSPELQSRFTNENIKIEVIDGGIKYYFEHETFHEIIDQAKEEGWNDAGFGNNDEEQTQ